MAKRSFAEFGSGIGEPGSVASIIQLADTLANAAAALRDDLRRVSCRHIEADDVGYTQALQCLTRYNREITGTSQLLQQYQEHGLVSASVEETSQMQKATRRDESHRSARAQSSSLSVALPIPCPVGLTKWTNEDIPRSGRPSLPQVLDGDLETAALTHSGMVTEKQNSLSYERLEWMGDAYLYLISTAFIFQTFPNLSPGRSAQLREKLVKNDTLSEYSLYYGMDQRARFPAEFGLGGRSGGSQASDKNRKKVLGDIFEAYVAAVVLGSPDGLSRMSTFLKTIWGETIAPEIQKETKTETSEAQDGLNPKVALSKILGYKGVKLSYRDIGEPKKAKDTKLPIYTVGVFLDGWGEADLQLGFGSALQKKEAGAKAAQQAIENKRLLGPLVKKRQDFLNAIERQKEHDSMDSSERKASIT